jgi:dTDP-4-dehydrorhamnose 3,5-epimerase-like enzyme
MNTINECRVVDLARIERPEGNITPIEGEVAIPFSIARVYYLYDVVGGSERGGHAHLELEQLLVAVMGAFTVVIDDGERRREVELNRGYHGLYIPRLIWRELVNFSSGAVCVVLASHEYSEQDYVRDYEEFRGLRRSLVHQSS